MGDRTPTTEAKNHLDRNWDTEEGAQSGNITLVAKGQNVSIPPPLTGQDSHEGLTTSRSGYLLRLLAYHMPALAISFVLIWQNSSRQFWFDFETSVWVYGREFDANSILDMLQIAAKLYELLVLVSLSTIALDMYRIKLIGSGLPLGLITSGYRVGDLSYLKHTSLLSTFNTGAAAFAGFTVLATLLSVAMGPASAILMVPGTGWWQFKDSADSLQLQIRLEPYYDVTGISDPWPTLLGADWLNSTGLLTMCNELRAVDYPQCPHYGFGAINDWTTACISNRLAPNISIASPSASSEVRRWLSVSNLGSSKDGATLATTASSAALEAVGYFVDYLTLYYLRNSSAPKDLRVTISPEDQLYQPLVQSKCEVYDWQQSREALDQSNTTTGLPHWSMEGIDCFNDTVCSGWKELDETDRQIDSQYWDYDPTAEVYPIFGWVDLRDGPLAAVVKLPYLQLNKSKDTEEQGEQRWWFSVCTFVPHWAPSTISLAIRRTNVVEATTPYINGGDFDLNSDSPSGGPMVNRMIQVEREWVDLINIPVNDTRAAQYATMSYDDPTAPATIGAIESLLTNLIWPTDIPPPGMSFSLLSVFEYGYSTIGLATGLEKVLGLILVNALSLSTSTMASAGPYLVVEKDHDSRTLLYPSAFSPDSFDPTRLARGSNDSCQVLSTSEEQGVYCINTYGSFDEAVQGIEDNLAWNFALDQFGYGSGIPSPTLTFALAMVYLYLALILAYFLGLLACSRWTMTQDLPVRVASWSDMQDLIVLAWKSRCPDELQNTGAGLKPFSRLWNKRAMVRVTPGNHLELITEGDTSGMDRVRGSVYYKQ